MDEKRDKLRDLRPSDHENISFLHFHRTHFQWGLGLDDVARTWFCEKKKKSKPP